MRAQIKDISKLFETVMDFKGLSFLITEQSLIKNQRLFFYFFATVILQMKQSITWLDNHKIHFLFPSSTIF